MLYVPGELVRRAATNVSSAVVSVSSTVSNTVSSGVSTVASVATGSRRRSLDRSSSYQDMDQMLVNAKEKYTLNLKVKHVFIVDGPLMLYPVYTQQGCTNNGQSCYSQWFYDEKK